MSEIREIKFNVAAEAAATVGLQSPAPKMVRRARLREGNAAEISALNGTAARPNPCMDGSDIAEAHHRIANHFALLSGYVHLRASDLNRRATAPDRMSVQLLLQSIQSQIDAIALLHRTMAGFGTDVSVDVGVHLQRVLSPFASGSFGNVKLTEQFDDACRVPNNQILPISQIVVEVVTNAIKHGREGNIEVTVACRRYGGGGGLLVEICDNGPGFTDGFDPAKCNSIGLRLLRALADQLHAQISFESNDRGLAFRLLILPVKFDPGAI